MASFVPKLAGKVVQWLDLQKDDVLLDIGCGGEFPIPLDGRFELTLVTDGILNAEFAKILAQGNGSMVGIDSSASMIDSARELCKDSKNSTFEGAFYICPCFLRTTTYTFPSSHRRHTTRL